MVKSEAWQSERVKAMGEVGGPGGIIVFIVIVIFIIIVVVIIT